MAKHRVITSDKEIGSAIERAKLLKAEPRVVSAEYVPGTRLDFFILKMSNGQRHLIPREALEGLQHARRAQLATVEILGNGTGLHWPALDVDHYVPSLLNEIYGTKKWMEQIGRRGGSVKSAAKRKAARANGLRGGRPKRDSLPVGA